MLEIKKTVIVDKSFFSDVGKLKYKEVVELHHGQLFNSVT